MTSKAASDVIERLIDDSIDDSIDGAQLSPVALADGLEDMPEDPTTDLCCCGHPLERHDAHGLRYCRATVSNELRRRCICVDPTVEFAGRR
jgi:hypothetical protein